MVDAFLKSSTSKINQLSKALDEEDWQAVAYVAHNLTGSTSALGLHCFEARARQLEKAAKDNNSDRVKSLFEGFELIHHQSTEELRGFWERLRKSQKSGREQEA